MYIQIIVQRKEDTLACRAAVSYVLFSDSLIFRLTDVSQDCILKMYVKKNRSVEKSEEEMKHVQNYDG